MKPRLSQKANRAFTAVELVVILLVIAVVVMYLLPQLKDAKLKAGRITCCSNQKQIGLAYKLWEGDNHGVLPMGVSVTNGGSMEDALAGQPFSTFLVMSNELATPYILWCPSDLERWRVKNFTNFTVSNLSFFVSADVTNDMNLQAILCGDRQFEVGGRLVHSGLVAFSTNDSVTWPATTGHKNFGNISIGDGSVQSVNSKGLKDSIQQSGMATNRFAVP